MAEEIAIGMLVRYKYGAEGLVEKIEPMGTTYFVKLRDRPDLYRIDMLTPITD